MTDKPFHIGDRVRLKRPDDDQYGWRVVSVPVNGDRHYALAHETGDKVHAREWEIERTSL